ncbi:IucA/IucC family protein [Actinoplanes sp. CA-030573]|uniref:IucA/IucC family protein n=1 Tax=Actinoplanes sp. CA-030573 TaxID=3239898 RepID=UPI003D92BACB
MPRPPSSSPPLRHTADPAQTRADLAGLRPDLVGRYDAKLPGAKAAVLARLLGALDREPLPGLNGRRPGEASFPGVTVRYPAGAATAFAPAAAGLAAFVRAGSYEAGATGPGGPIEPVEGTSPQPGAVVMDPGTLVRVLWPGSDLAAEVDNSVANLALARAGSAATAAGSSAVGEPIAVPLPAPGDPDGLAWAEQSIVDGHPLHPCCRTRGGMSVADVLAYGPEHRPVIRLRRLKVPAGRWHGTAEPVLLAHPWQAERLRDRYPWLADDGETGPALPLMSLRTVAMAGGGPHVKTAVDVQMTSAVRTVSPAAVENGPVLSALLRHLTADLPIDVLAETAAGAVLVDGQPQRHLAFLVREAPRLAANEIAVPLALYGVSEALQATVPDPYELMGLLGGLLFAPLVRVLDRGVALEAHGQNTLVVLRDHRPVRILYRDLGGVRVSARRLREASVDAPRLRGDLPSDDPAELRAKLAAAALGTVAAELIAALTRRGADPARLWGIVAAALRETGARDVPHLLRDPLPVKATTAMRLAADPLDDIWAHLDNPLAAHA